MLGLYRFVTRCGALPMRGLLRYRTIRGKEAPDRLGERMGRPALPRPDSDALIWLHAASVGEAQSALIIIERLLSQNPYLHILVTTGTQSSADIMANRLPSRAFHQFIPLDHPTWINHFLDYWRPCAVLWMESELWPNMLGTVRHRQIPAFLLNARLSERSFRRWKCLPANEMKDFLSVFHAILTQSPDETGRFKALGADQATTTGNLKYDADPLPVSAPTLETLQNALAGRPLWLYASTHDGEEDLACRLHQSLRKTFPGLLTIIVPRHPERRGDISATCEKYDLKVTLRGTHKTLPQAGDDIYLADTLGELGLFYALAPVCCIGRSFSNDGGGGHNPIEAARHDCAILYGPHIRNLADIYSHFEQADAAIRLADEDDFKKTLSALLNDPEKQRSLRTKAAALVKEQAQALTHIENALAPFLPKQEQDKHSTCA